MTEGPEPGSEGRIAVAVSGAGSNLRALVAAERRGELGGRIVLVLADRPCPALDWAVEQGFDTALVPDGADDAVADALRGAAPDVIALAGYMRLIGPLTLEAFPGRIVNTHPSLLPAFPGAHAVRDALAHGAAVTGATIHLVDATLDGGPIVAQEAVPIVAGDDEASVQERIRAVEHRLLPRVVGPAAGRGGRRRRAARDDRRRPGRRAHPRPAARPPVGQRQEGPRRARHGSPGSPVRARLHWRHGARPARGRPAGHGRCRRHRLPGDARRTSQDAPSRGSTAGSWPTAASSTTGASSWPPRSPRSSSSSSTSTRSRPPRHDPGSSSTRSSRRSTSAGRRWSGPRPRTTPASRSSPRLSATRRSSPRWRRRGACPPGCGPPSRSRRTATRPRTTHGSWRSCRRGWRPPASTCRPTRACPARPIRTHRRSRSPSRRSRPCATARTRTSRRPATGAPGSGPRPGRSRPAGRSSRARR